MTQLGLEVLVDHLLVGGIGRARADTVGDPFEDTVKPSLNKLVTVISQLSSLFAPLIRAYSLIGV